MGQPFSEGTGALVPVSTALPAVPVNTDTRDAIADKWVREYSVRSVHTANRYRRDIRVFFDWADAQGFDVFAMLPWHIGEYAVWLKEADHLGRYKGSTTLSPATRSGRLNAVSSFYRFVQENVRERFIPNPAEHVRRPVVSRESKTRGLDAAELEKLRAIALARGSREYALVQLLAGTGLRITEAVAADTGDLKREAGGWYLHVIRKGSEDKVPVQVPEAAARAIRRYLRGRRGPLFLDEKGKRMTRNAAANRIRSMGRKAVGDPKAMISPHSLRHTATTLALNKGVHMRDVASLMGHRSMETTARYDRANRLRDNPAAAALAEIIADDLPDTD